MKSFEHLTARTVSEAVLLLSSYQEKAKLNAGGTDLLGILKDDIFSKYPEVMINIKEVSELRFIKEDDIGLRIGALTKLTDLVKSPAVQGRYAALAEAAKSVATPQIRNVATLGGNLCQDVRCWYYRYSHQIGGRIPCARKGAGPCHAVGGDNRYHAILAGKKCFAVCPSDTAVALAALDATIQILSAKGERTVRVQDFFEPMGSLLKKDEIVTEIRIPKPEEGARQRFDKFTLRKGVEFAVVSVASMIHSENGICRDARIALGAIAPAPIRATRAEAFLRGNKMDAGTAEKAAAMALDGAKPLSMNAYKVEIAMTLVKRAVLSQ